MSTLRHGWAPGTGDAGDDGPPPRSYDPDTDTAAILPVVQVLSVVPQAEPSTSAADHPIAARQIVQDRKSVV